jgi:hypothetical protein
MWAHKSSTVFLSISAASFSKKGHRIRFRNFTGSVDLGIVLNELTDAVNEVAFFHLLLELLFAEVGQPNQYVHQHRHLDVLSDELQQLLHNLLYGVWLRM